MYIVNFTICFSFLLIISIQINKNVNKQKCHNHAMTHLFQNSLKKTLDKQNPYSKQQLLGGCKFLTHETRGTHYALGVNFKQKLLLTFKGKASNDR